VAHPRRLDRVTLVLVHGEAARAGVVATGLGPEDPLALEVEQSLIHQLLDQAAGLEARVKAQPWVRPLDASVGLLVDEGLDAGMAHLDEAGREGAVVVDQPLVDCEDVHVVAPGCSCTSGHDHSCGRLNPRPTTGAAVCARQRVVASGEVPPASRRQSEQSPQETLRVPIAASGADSSDVCEFCSEWFPIARFNGRFDEAIQIVDFVGPAKDGGANYANASRVCTHGVDVALSLERGVARRKLADATGQGPGRLRVAE
jgi:hypothetical protein